MTAANTTLRLDRLSLRNFRCFAECAIDLHPTLTVLVAENAQGKTAILDAIGIALRLFVDTLSGTRPLHGFDRTDVRLSPEADGTMLLAVSMDFTARGVVAGRSLDWSRALNGKSPQARTSTANAKDFLRAAVALRENVEQVEGSGDPLPVLLPLVAFYGTGRLWSEHRLTEGKRSYFTASHDRLSGYVDCLSSSSSFKGMVAWYEQKMTEIGDPTFSTELRKNVPLILAVQEATRVVLEPTGWSRLDWTSDGRSLMVEHATHGRLPLSALSDGVRNMIALVADVARRCATLNPHLSEQAARETPGVLLIDEVDMHLHPRWQQLIVGLLQQAFPKMQMVLSTHSPHVLSTVDVDSIRVVGLGDGQGDIGVPTFQTRGVESASILAEVMYVNAVPPVEQATWLSDYKALVQTSNEDSTAARNLWGKLVEHFGEGHPIMVEVAVLRRLQEFRRKNDVSPKQGH